MASSVTKPEGFSSLIKYYESGTSEIRYLLNKECEMMYECKWCREIFRSIVTFVSHKRSGCRSMFADLTDELELAKKFQKRQKEERGELVGTSKQGRLNLETLLEEQIRPVSVTLPHSKKAMELMTLPRTQKSKPVTEFVGGYQRLVEMPTEMAIASQVPDDRIVVVMPQEKSSRYGEMQLRKRRVDERYATFTADQIKILQRIPDDVLTFANVANLECKHSSCKSYRPFDTFEALAYHLNLTHHSVGEDGHQCYLCDSKTYNTFDKLKGHLKLKHALVRKNHIDSRKKLSRRAYKRGQDYEHRSISPLGYVENEDGAESDNASDNGLAATDSPVTFLGTPIKQEEEIIDDPIPILKRMPIRRGRRQKGRSAAIKPVLSPAKIRQAAEPSSQPTSTAIEFNINSIDEFLNIHSNESSLSNQLQTKKTRQTKNTPKKVTRTVREVSQVSSSGSSEKDQDDRDEESREVKISLDELMETDSGEGELNEDGEPVIKRRKPVSLIKGRTPRQRNQTSRLNQDYVVPKKYASTTNMLSENQFRAFAKEQAKQLKKDKRTRRKRKSGPQSTESSQQPGDSANSLQGDDVDELREEVQIQKRGRKRRLAPGQGKGSSVSEDDEFDNATQLLLQQVKNSLTKASTPSGDVQPKQEGSSSNSSATPEPSSQESFVLPPLSTAKGSANSLQEPGKIRSGSTNASPMKTIFPSIMTGSESELINYSPRKPQRLQEGVPKITDETRGEAASRRKQNFAEKKDDNDAASDVKLLQMPGQQPLKPDDLTQLPVNLNTAQRRMLFGPLKPLFNSNRDGADGLHQCAECGAVCKTLAEGHKHMVSHVRMVRLKCSLCDAGSFFCTDMRKHLMYRYCANLNYAPPEMLHPGTPCMDAKTADKLIRITSQTEPGRATFTRGMIISAERPTPYLPDPRIEQRLLGSLRAVNRASPRKIVLTSRRKSPSNEPQQGQATNEDSQGDSQSLSQAFNGDDDGGRSSKDSTPPITTNDLLNQAENAAASPEFLIQSGDTEKKGDQSTNNYPLPLTIRANPPAPQKTPSPEPSSSNYPQDDVAKEVVISSASTPQHEQEDMSGIPAEQQPNPKQLVPTAVRSPALKPSILSRSPIKAPVAQEPSTHSANSISTPIFQQKSETTIVDTIEQTLAPSSSDSSQHTQLTASEDSHGNGDSAPYFLNDQPRIIVTDENP